MSVNEFTGTLKVDYELGDTDDTILKKCTDILENRCGTNGFVIPRTVEIVARSPPQHVIGKVSMQVHVNYKCKIGVVNTGDVIDVFVTKITKGVGAMASVYVENTEIGKVIIPDDIQEDGKRANENDTVKVRILTSAHSFGSDMYRGVGKIL